MIRWILLLLFLQLVPLIAEAQSQRRGVSGRANCRFGARWNGDYFVHPDHPGNIPYDGRFTFARLMYTGDFSCVSEGPGWAHDYPEAESNFMLILRELTLVRPHMDRFNIVRMDSPDLFKHPALYFSEPGGWRMTDAEMNGLRAYLMKGGFIVIDDFPRSGYRGRDDYSQFAYQLKRLLPDAEVMNLELNHPIFDSFFHITEPWKSGSNQDGYTNPEFYAVFEDNDPTKRVMMVINYSNDLGENWQFSSSGMQPLDRTNESWRLGINYYIYALTR
jgi:hypothetical protein